MNALRRALASIGKATRILLGVVALIAVLWAIAYRLILGFTPLWLDITTMVAAALGVLVLLALGRHDAFDYSIPVDKSPSGSSSE